MKTLMVTEGETQAWKLLGENVVGLFGDNGGNPDGNAWLPSEFVNSIEGAMVIGAGLGKMVEAFWLDDGEIAEMLGIEDVLAYAREYDDWELMQSEAEDRTRYWAHYNAYGANDSRWVIVRK